MSKAMLELANIKESMMMAIDAVRNNRLRSVLTLIGIVVGVFSIISVMTAMGVLRNSIEEGLAMLGANTFQIQKFPTGFGRNDMARFRNRKDLTYKQALQLQAKATLAEAVGIESWEFGRIVWWNGEKTNPNIFLAGENLEGIVTNDWFIGTGRGMTTQDIDLSSPVVVLGAAVAEKLFPPYISAIGQTVRIDGVLYKVIGVYEKKYNALGGNTDNFVTIPITTYFHKYGRSDKSVNIMVKARSREVYQDCLEQSRAILRAARQVPPGADDDFAYFSNDSLITQFNELTFYVRIGVLLVSCIALLAAGVGIMNIMLVSVTERTREIGVRKALGAQRSNILSQFILEAVILCQIGGIVGIVLGITGGNLVGLLMEVPAIIPWDWVGVGLAVCTIVGLIFGVYPAWKASLLDPIESLRYE